MNQNPTSSNSPVSFLIMNLESIGHKCRKEIFNHFKNEIVKDLTVTGRAKRAEEDRKISYEEAEENLMKNEIAESKFVAPYFKLKLKSIWTYKKIFLYLDAISFPYSESKPMYNSIIVIKLKKYLDQNRLSLNAILTKLKEAEKRKIEGQENEFALELKCEISKL